MYCLCEIIITNLQGAVCDVYSSFLFLFIYFSFLFGDFAVYLITLK